MITIPIPPTQYFTQYISLQRSIDFFCPDTGEDMLRLHQPGFDKIISLSQFSPNGDFLLSGMFGSILVWKQVNYIMSY